LKRGTGGGVKGSGTPGNPSASNPNINNNNKAGKKGKVLNRLLFEVRNRDRIYYNDTQYPQFNTTYDIFKYTILG